MGRPAETMISPTSRMRARRPEGFTLIEVTLVAVVMAIVLLASLPRFQRTAQRLQVEGTAFELVQLLRYARERAVADNRETVWAWSSDGRRAQLYQLGVEPGTPAVTRLEGRLARTRPAQAGLTVVAEESPQPVPCPAGMPSAAACVSFLPDGTGDPVVLQVRADDESAYLITVKGATGHAQLSARPPAPS